jgi:Leucine-rich repeat (LRR) protein
MFCSWTGVFCSWTGVSCDPNGDIASLQLIDNCLLGIVPAELAILAESLRDLDLSNNDILGDMPSSLGKMSKLESLICHPTVSVPLYSH